MASDDQRTDGRTGGGAGDPMRDLLLGLAAQIDQVAALFAGGRGRHAATGERSAGGQFDDSGLAEATGELTSLLAEIGDLLARLIAALIAVLEALAAALRSSPADVPTPRHYQAIAVRIDPRPAPGSAGPADKEDGNG